MGQYACGNGHQWIDADPIPGQPWAGCPQCRIDVQREAAQNANLKNLIKQAVLEALKEYGKPTQ